MFSFRLANDYRLRAMTAIPSPRGLFAAIAAPGALIARVPLGAFASLGAIALGATLMIANVAREQRAPEAAVAAEPPPTAPAPVETVAIAPPKAEPAKSEAVKPDPVAALAAPAAAPEKSTARVDTTPIGDIDPAPKLKPKHKHRPKKAKEMDNGQ